MNQLSGQLRIWQWIAFAVLLISGCSDEECSNSSLNDPQLTISFVQINDSTNREVALSVTLLGITGVGSTEDTLVNPTGAVSQVRLPMPQDADEATFVLYRTTPNETDSLTVSFVRKPLFISQACGFEIQYENLAVVRQTFGEEQVAVTQSTITATPNEVHLKVRY